MFYINYKINLTALTGSTTYLEDNVYGYIELDFVVAKYGYCPRENIPIEGHDILSIWFEQLTEICSKLIQHKMVLLNEISSYNSWLRFSRDGDEVVIDHILSENKDGHGFITENELKETVSGELNGIRISYKQMCEEVVEKTEKFVEELIRINPVYQNAGWIETIKNNIVKMETE